MRLILCNAQNYTTIKQVYNVWVWQKKYGKKQQGDY